MSHHVADAIEQIHAIAQGAPRFYDLDEMCDEYDQDPRERDERDEMEDYYEALAEATPEERVQLSASRLRREWMGQ